MLGPLSEPAYPSIHGTTIGFADTESRLRVTRFSLAPNPGREPQRAPSPTPAQSLTRRDALFPASNVPLFPASNVLGPTQGATLAKIRKQLRVALAKVQLAADTPLDR